MSQPTPDDIFLKYSEESVGLEIRLITDSEDGPFVLISGKRSALRFLSEVLAALAESPNVPASKQFGPTASGAFHLSKTSDIDVYLECTE